MAGAAGYTIPTNKIIVFNPYAKLPTTTCKVQTATNMIPGRLVKRNSTSDADIIVNTSANTPIGWLGFEETNAKYTAGAEMAITDAYAVNDVVAVHNGPGVVFKGWLTTGQTVYKGTPLVAGGDGELTPAASISLTETGTSTHHSASAGSIPVGGLVIAIAEGYYTGAVAIIARSLI
jgi:hypothetical protein